MDKYVEKEAASAAQKSLWNKNYIIVLLIGFIAGTANQMINPLISKYAVSLGASLTLAGSIVGLQSGIAIFLRPVAGVVADNVNRKYVVCGSVALTAIASIGYLLFSNIIAVVVCRTLQGIAYAFLIVALTAYATEYIPRERMGEGVTFISFGFILSQAIAPSVGLWVSEKFSYNASFAVALLFAVVGITLILSQKYSFKKPQEKRALRLGNIVAVEIIPYALISGLFAIVLALCNSFLALLGDERGIEGVGLFFTVTSIAALVIRVFLGKILDKFGLQAILYPALICASVTLVLIGSAHSLTLIVIAALGKALSQGAAMPSIQGAAVKRLGAGRAGVVSATIHMGQDIFATIAPVVGGALATSVGYGNMFYVFAVVVLLGVPGYMLIRHREKRDLR